MSSEINKYVDEAKKFAENSQKFIRKCEKPDSKCTVPCLIPDYITLCHIEFVKIATSCAIGFAVMGAIGYAIKLLFIPINNIILS